MEIRRYQEADIPAVLAFERELRTEDSWGWEIDEAYEQQVRRSFGDLRFQNALSFLAVDQGCVIGRIDAALICSHFDGSVKAYLDWLCVLKRARHQGVAQALLAQLRQTLREEYQVDTLIALMASHPEAQHFYRSITGAMIRDEGIWMDC